MKELTLDGQTFKLPNELNDFQERMYIHLIDWKRKCVTEEVGHHEHKGKRIPYDAILPDDYVSNAIMPHIYKPILERLAVHRTLNPFRIHPHFYHMASSQAANINLFLPVLHHPNASAILANIAGAPKDFQALATDKLDHGYCLEFWGGNLDLGSPRKGLLGDKSKRAGTDSDIAIAYYNNAQELCLWLVEHKLVEAEFTTCGGYKSDGRTDKVRHDCTRSFTRILDNKCTCYYHDKCGYNYWNITEKHRDFFPGHDQHEECPFQGGMNQLWRNQLLGLAIEDEGNEFKHVHFSVVHHPDNEALKPTLDAYRKLIGYSATFSSFTSADVVRAATANSDSVLHSWILWYKDLYNI